MRSFLFLCVVVTGCAHLPATGAPATGEPLAVHAENVTHTWTSNDKVGEVKHKDENGNVIGTSDVYAEREHQATVLEWFPQQGNSRVDDRDFFNIAGDVEATQEVEGYRNTGITMNRVGLGLLAGGLALLAGGIATYYGVGDQASFNPGYILALGGALVTGTGAWLTWLGIARENPEVHPVDADRAQVAAAKYNAQLVARTVPVPEPTMQFALPDDAPVAKPPRKVTDKPKRRARTTANAQ